MDLKSGCAFEAGSEPQTKKDGCYETRRQDIGKMKAFSTKTKTKEIFKGGSKTIQYPPTTTTRSYLIIIPEKPIITTNKIPSLESKSTIRIQQILITTRPQPQDYSKTKRKLSMKKLAKRIQYTKGLLATRCLLWYTTRFKTRDSLTAPVLPSQVPHFQDLDPDPRPTAWLSCCYHSLL